MKLIDKDVVLAIIENRIRACGNCYILDELTSLHRTFDSIEATEVDYDKALTEYLGNFENASIGHRLSIRRTAKYFFELGLKAQKVE